MTSPLRTVLAAFESGARTRTEVVRHTGLRADLVDAATEHLIRLGRVRAEPLSTSCPSGRCGSCPLSRTRCGT